MLISMPFPSHLTFFLQYVIKVEEPGHNHVLCIDNNSSSAMFFHSVYNCFSFQLLEACVKNCGQRFHQELGKFRFLNELIRMISPKVGRATVDRVIRTLTSVCLSQGM